MKILVIASMVILSGATFGTSLMVPNIRLQSSSVRLLDSHHLPAGERPATVITVDSRGNVLGARCTEKNNIVFGKPQFTNCHTFRNVERLSSQEQASVETLIEEARDGEIKYPNPGGIHCLAMPTRADRYTADNGKVFLSAGVHPCGDVTYNTSEAAKSLVKSLRNYESKYKSLLRTDME